MCTQSEGDYQAFAFLNPGDEELADLEADLERQNLEFGPPPLTEPEEKYLDKWEKKMAKIWVTKAGKEVKIKDMSDSHLLNTIHMLRRFELSDAINKVKFMSTVSGDGASMAAEEEAERLAERKVDSLFPVYKHLLKEAKNRKLRVDNWCSKCQRFHRANQRSCKTVYCRSCRKSHPTPVNVHHAATLKCNAKFKRSR